MKSRFAWKGRVSSVLEETSLVHASQHPLRRALVIRDKNGSLYSPRAVSLSKTTKFLHHIIGIHEANSEYQIWERCKSGWASHMLQCCFAGGMHTNRASLSTKTHFRSTICEHDAHLPPRRHPFRRRVDWDREPANRTPYSCFSQYSMTDWSESVDLVSNYRVKEVILSEEIFSKCVLYGFIVFFTVGP